MKWDVSLQVSSTMVLSLRWQTYNQVKSTGNQTPPCMWRDKHSMWPGALQVCCTWAFLFTYTVHTPHHWFALLRRHWQKDFSWDVKNGENIPCWFVNNSGMGLVDGGASDYIVSDLFMTVWIFWMLYNSEISLWTHSTSLCCWEIADSSEL